MSVDNFIPQIWSARLLENLHKTLVYGQAGVVNRDYEGEIAQWGDRVHINNIGPISVKDYTKNQDIDGPETLTDDRRTLVIDQQKYFNFQIDDVDMAQTRPKLMDEAMREAAFALGDVADQFLADKYTEVAAGNEIGSQASPEALTPEDAYDAMVDMAVKLTESNIPRNGRWIVVPPWFHGLLLKDDRFVSFGTAENRTPLQNGVIGRAAGFDVLESNNVPEYDDVYVVLAGHPIAWTYAEQIPINQMEAYRPEKRFADAMKGLHLYGAKVVRPEGLVALYAEQAAS